MAPVRGWLYPGMAFAVLVTVVVGFGPSYFWRTLSDLPPLSPLVHVHGLVFTAWVVLFLTQVTLVANGRRDIHRILGMGGALLALAMLVVGWQAAIAQAQREVAAGNADAGLGFLIVPIGDLVSFAVLVGYGITWRTRTDLHRRLMVLASIAILPAAIGRIPALEHPATFSLYFIALLAVVPVHDWMTHTRVHPVSVWGGLAVYVSELGRFLLQDHPAWRAIAEWLVA